MRKLNFLFTTWEGGGNVTPALVVVRKLVARGHRVRLMSDACNRPDAEAAGAVFVSWQRAPNRTERTRATQVFKDYAQPTPHEGFMSCLRDAWCGPALAYARDVIDELRREPADLVVTNELLFGVMAGCEKLGQKFVTLCPNISLAPLPGIPPMGPGLPPARTDEDRALHAQIAAGGVQLFDSGLEFLNPARIELGLLPLEHLLDQYDRASAQLLATSAAFDFTPDRLPGNVRYVGPQIGDPAWAKEWKSPWPPDDTRPLVTVGFSTTFQNHARVMQKVIDALSALPVRVLVTLGGSIEQRDLRAADNCVLVDSAPHSRLMREATLAITHGGHGTVMQALYARVPMLIIPHGRDQNDNAIRVTHRGAGLSLQPDAGVETIRSACERLLDEPSFRLAAKKLGDAVALDAQQSTVVQDLENSAATSTGAARKLQPTAV